MEKNTTGNFEFSRENNYKSKEIKDNNDVISNLSQNTRNAIMDIKIIEYFSKDYISIDVHGKSFDVTFVDFYNFLVKQKYNMTGISSFTILKNTLEMYGVSFEEQCKAYLLELLSGNFINTQSKNNLNQEQFNSDNSKVISALEENKFNITIKNNNTLNQGGIAMQQVPVQNMIQQGYPVMQQGYPVMQQGYPVMQQGYPVMQQGYPVMQQGYPVMQQGYPVMQQGYLVMQQGYPVMQQGYPVMQQVPVYPNMVQQIPVQNIVQQAPVQNMVQQPIIIPVETPKTPVETPKTPVETPKTPVETPKTPVEAPKTPVETPKTPVETPKNPVEAPKNPVETPIVPVEAPKTPVETPKNPVETPKTPVETPKTPVETPKTPVEAPKNPVEAPKTPVEAPKTPVEAPKTPVEAPKTPVETPITPENKVFLDEIEKIKTSINTTLNEISTLIDRSLQNSKISTNAKNQIKEVLSEFDLKTLKEEKNRLEELYNEIKRTMENSYTKEQMSNIAIKLVEISSSYGDLNIKINTCLKKLSEIDLKEEILEDPKINSLKAEIKELQDRINTLEKSDKSDKNNQEINILKEEIEKLQDRINTWGESGKNNQEINTLKAEIKELKDRINILETDEKDNQEINALKAEIDKMKEELESIKNNTGNSAETTELINTVNSLNEKIKILEEKLKNTDKNEQNNEEMKKLKEELITLKTEIANIKKEKEKENIPPEEILPLYENFKEIVVDLDAKNKAMFDLYDTVKKMIENNIQGEMKTVLLNQLNESKDRFIKGIAECSDLAIHLPENSKQNCSWYQAKNVLGQEIASKQTEYEKTGKLYTDNKEINWIQVKDKTGKLFWSNNKNDTKLTDEQMQAIIAKEKKEEKYKDKNGIIWTKNINENGAVFWSNNKNDTKLTNEQMIEKKEQDKKEVTENEKKRIIENYEQSDFFIEASENNFSKEFNKYLKIILDKPLVIIDLLTLGISNNWFKNKESEELNKAIELMKEEQKKEFSKNLKYYIEKNTNLDNDNKEKCKNTFKKIVKVEFDTVNELNTAEQEKINKYIESINNSVDFTVTVSNDINLVITAISEINLENKKRLKNVNYDNLKYIWNNKSDSTDFKDNFLKICQAYLDNNAIDLVNDKITDIDKILFIMESNENLNKLDDNCVDFSVISNWIEGLENEYKWKNEILTEKINTLNDDKKKEVLKFLWGEYDKKTDVIKNKIFAQCQTIHNECLPDQPINSK